MTDDELRAILAKRDALPVNERILDLEVEFSTEMRRALESNLQMMDHITIALRRMELSLEVTTAIAKQCGVDEKQLDAMWQEAEQKLYPQETTDDTTEKGSG